MRASARIRTRTLPLLPALLLAITQPAVFAQPTRSAGVVADSSARFDWFSYQGRDPVYERMRADDGSYLNPILPGFYPDPAVTRVGDDYYLVTSSFAYFPGIPLFHSRDLVHWRQIGSVLDRPSQLRFDGIGITRGVFAPAITHRDGVFYVISTLVDAGGNMLVTATNPAGPWSDPVWLDFDGIDPSLFFDDDGRAYIINNGPPEGTPLYQGHRALWMQEYDVAAKKLVGPRRLVVNGGVDITKQPIWIEAPHILKVNGTYYLIAAEGGTAEEHSEVVFRSASVWGPWEPYARNPILTQRHLAADRPFPITSTGHASFVQTPNGEWWAVFLGVRPYQGNHYNNGRETYLLPVRWQDGWPHILDGDATVPYVQRRPNLPRHAPADVMKAGNFIERDDFAGNKLKPYWSFIRTVREQWYDLTSNPGWLTLQPRPAHIGRLEQPSFIGRRQQHAFATVTTALRYTPVREGDRAGLAAFHTDDFYYLFVVTRRNGQPVVQLEKSGGANSRGATQVLTSAPLTSPPGSVLYLKIDANGATYDFAYAYEPDRWITLQRGVDGTHLSTKVAGAFVGTMFGMYAYAEPASAAARTEAEVVQRSIDAYNRRDVDAYTAMFADDAEVFNFPGEVVLRGREQIRAAFARSFAASPGGNVEVLNRMIQGQYVIIHGRIVGVMPEPYTGVAIHDVQNGRIRRLWLIEEGAAPAGPPAVTLPGTQLRSIRSGATGRTYDIYVHLPADYSAQPNVKYPVLYLLDAQWDFKLLASIYGGLVYDRHIPPLIIVGITYAGSNADYNTLRAMDYTPVSEARVNGSGDGAKFLSFLKTELMPLIESSYRTDPARRTLMGSSYGGLFTLYALFAEPELFNAYVAGSPAVPYANRFTFTHEAAFAARRNNLPARLFLAVGGAEPLAAPVQEFARTVQMRNYRGLTMETLVVQDEGHSSNKPEAFNRGLRFALSQPASDSLRMPRLFQDGMVLQRDVRVPVWGRAGAGNTVQVSLAGNTARAVADASGAWRVELPALRAGGPHTLTVSADATSHTIRDVLVGDVWIASGQSNMEWPLSAATGGAAAIANARDSQLREFAVPHSWAESPQDDLEGGSWAAADPQHAGRFSAIGYFFARDLRRATGVPIGIIHTSWGGSAIETWLSRESLGLSENEWHTMLQNERAREAALRDSLRARIGELPTTDLGLVDGRAVWAEPQLDDKAWTTISVPSLWEQAGFAGLDGTAWYRTTFTLSDAEAKQGVRIGLGRIDDDDITWVNGSEVGRTQGYSVARAYNVPPSALRAGANLLAIRVSDGGGGGGPYGDAAQFYIEVNGTRRPLAAPWKFRVGSVIFRADGQRVNKIPTVLYNRMLHPLQHYPIRGVIWYQGESNANNDAQARAYRAQFAQLISAWRREWRGAPANFPFLWVQLPNFGTVDRAPPSTAAWAHLRESQAAALALPNTGQVVAIDVGDPQDIHPRDKEPVGQRLAALARRVAYGENVLASGPTYRRHTVRGNTIVVEFDDAGGGLISRTGATVRGFAIAGANKQWVWADARIENGSVIVSSTAVPNPVAVRYAWSNSPDQPGLFNREGWPAAPFRTDGW